MKPWHVYMVRCCDGSYYTGISTDPARRTHEHNHTKKGARYTRAHRPVVLVWQKELGDQTEAMRIERFIKSLSHLVKQTFLDERPDLVEGGAWPENTPE